MPNFYLGDAQNAIDGTDITGRKVGNEPDKATDNATNTNNAGALVRDQA